jgi:hypothetical protein
VKMPGSRSSALLCCVTSCDHLRFGFRAMRSRTQPIPNSSGCYRRLSPIER